MNGDERQMWSSREIFFFSYFKMGAYREYLYIVGKDPVVKDMFIKVKFIFSIRKLTDCIILYFKEYIT